MANFAQYLNVSWISAKRGFGAVRFYVVPLKRCSISAFFTLTSFRNHLRNSFSAGIRPFTGTIVPFGVINPSHVSAANCSHARNRAVFTSTASAFTYLKRRVAFFTNTSNKCFCFTRFNFFRACARTRVGIASYMGVGSGKLYTASSACKRSMPSTNNFSFGV